MTPQKRYWYRVEWSEADGSGMGSSLIYCKDPDSACETMIDLMLEGHRDVRILKVEKTSYGQETAQA